MNQNQTILSLFEEIAKNHPEKIAVYLDCRTVSYRELNEHANQYARFLQEKGVSKNNIVGIQLNRSYEMILAIYAVLKSGGVYLPLDPFSPDLRNKSISEDSQLAFIITENSLISKLENLYKHRALQLLSINTDVSKRKCTDLNIPLKPNNLAYVMYTSGTTGTPKGVMITHQALLNRLVWMQNTFPLNDNDIVFHKTHTCFDVAVWETCWWAIAGASVVCLPPRKEHDIKLFIKMIEKLNLSIIHFVPSVLRIFLAYLSEDFSMNRLKSLKYVFSSGEALDANSVNLFNKLFHKSSTVLVNLYGPTEATIDVSYFICNKNKCYQSVPIGKPIQNTQLYVLDDNFKPSGLNQGELYISGVGLALGYLNNPELTEKSFIDNPYLPGSKMYRTGDLVQLDEYNDLHFVGRKDDQIKLHGLRIELGEIKHHLVDHPSVEDAIVISDKNTLLTQRLIVFLIPRNKSNIASTSELKSFLKDRIPDYMIPDVYLWLSSIPLKENGKLDKDKLLSLL